MRRRPHPVSMRAHVFSLRRRCAHHLGGAHESKITMPTSGRAARLRECLASGEDTQYNSRQPACAYHAGEAQGSPPASAVVASCRGWSHDCLGDGAEVLLAIHFPPVHPDGGAGGQAPAPRSTGRRPRERRSPDPGRYGLVAAAPRVVPGAAEHVPVPAKGALVVGGRAPAPEPDGQGVAFELVGVVERVARVGVEAALHVGARLAPQRPLVADDLYALGLRSEVDVLDEEEAALHPLVGDRPPHVPGELPGADQPIQPLEVRARLARLLLPVARDFAVLVRHTPSPSHDAFSDVLSPTRVQRSAFATLSSRSIASRIPASIPEPMCASRASLLACCTSKVRVVRPSASANVTVFTASTSGMPSKTSVATIRSFGTISRYSPWKAASNPSSVTITYRQVPPTRRSTSATVTSPRFPLHQRPTNSGSVHALYTRCLGASNSRVMRICSSVGSVTLAFPLPVIPTPLPPPA